MKKKINNKVELGEIEVSYHAQVALERSGQQAEEFLARHKKGDWGEISREEKKNNNDIIEKKITKIRRIMSAYSTSFWDEIIWIITEPDKNKTTILFPCEFDLFFPAKENYET